MKLLTILALIAATSAATIESIKPTTIDLKTLEQRVYAQYGEGDAGCEMLHYLKTGERVDFMGNPDKPVTSIYSPMNSASACQYDYHVNISERGTEIWSRDGKFVDFIPFDSTSAWDKAMLNDNQ